MAKSFKDVLAGCKGIKTGNDTWIGNSYSAPCGWATYNKFDISHYEWHRRMNAGKK